ITEDNTFSNKLNQEDIDNFLNGGLIIATNKNLRVAFQLENSELKVKALVYKNPIEKVFEASKKGQTIYTDALRVDKEIGDIEDWRKKAFVYDQEKKETIELDVLKNAPVLTKYILEKEDKVEYNRYKLELYKLRKYLLEKQAKFPEIAKTIALDLNIVSKEISTINTATISFKQKNKGNKTDVQLNVNDPDMFQDANWE